MSKKRIPIPKELKTMLDESGRKWTVEQGGKHAKVKIDGVLVLSFPPAGCKESFQGGRRWENMMTCVRRHLRATAPEARV